MKKLMLLLALCALGVGCEKKEGMIVTDYKIINLIDSDIVVTLGGTEREQSITIKPDEIQTIKSYTTHYKGDRPESIMSPVILDLLDPNMKIDEQIVPESIWMMNYWKYDGSDVYNPTYFNATYTLIVTNELLETIKNL